MRLVTMQDEKTPPFLAAAALRIGTDLSAPTDNWGRGGLSARIDLESGRLGRAAAYPAGKRVLDWQSIHRDSGAMIEGVRIPGWAEIKAELLQLVSSAPFLRYVGWDVVSTEDGFRILEGNKFTDINHLQIHGPLLDDHRVTAFYRRHGVL